MKFSIRDMMLVTMIVALAVGWFVERRQLDFARINAEFAKTKSEADLATMKSQLILREQEWKQLDEALADHNIRVSKINGRVLVGPDSAFADFPLRMELPNSPAPTPHVTKP
jgi:hypothetical protein